MKITEKNKIHVENIEKLMSVECSGGPLKALGKLPKSYRIAETHM